MEMISTILEKIISKKVYGTFNLGSSTGISKYEFCKKDAKLLLNNEHGSEWALVGPTDFNSVGFDSFIETLGSIPSHSRITCK